MYTPVDALLVNPFFVRRDRILPQLPQNNVGTLRISTLAPQSVMKSQGTYLDRIRIDIDNPMLHTAMKAEVAQKQGCLQHPQLRLAVKLVMPL